MAFTRWIALTLPARGTNWHHAAPDAVPQEMPIITWVINYSSTLFAPRSWKEAGWQKTRDLITGEGKGWQGGRLHFTQVTIKPRPPFSASLSPNTLFCCFCFIGSHYLAQASLELVTFLTQPLAHKRWIQPGLAESLSFWMILITLPLWAFSG